MKINELTTISEYIFSTPEQNAFVDSIVYIYWGVSRLVICWGAFPLSAGSVLAKLIMCLLFSPSKEAVSINSIVFMYVNRFQVSL